MALGTITNGFKNIGPLATKVFTAMATEAQQAAFSEGIAAAQGQGLAASLHGVAQAAGAAITAMWPLLAIGVGIAAVVVSVKALSDAYNADAIAA